MTDAKKKGKYIGLAGAVAVHIAVVVFLLWMTFDLPEPQEESGVPVMLGDAPQASGWSDPSLVEVETMPYEPSVSQDATEQELLTQDMEETVALTPENDSSQAVDKPEKTEAEKAEEERRRAEAQAEQQRREAEEAARRRVSGAFGKGAKMESRGQAAEGDGLQGSPAGNASAGASVGVGGLYGEFNLGGRSIGAGGLPRPVYNVQDEGCVVVTITVNPAGHVIATEINKQTNTVNPALRKAAEDAARKARFNAVDGKDNQIGTITYYFNLK